jgi:hypothetical protein
MRGFALAVLAVLALPASAAAHGRPQTIAPPGNSGVQQYEETIPTARGGQPTSSVRRGQLGRPTSSVHRGQGGPGASVGGAGSGASAGGSGIRSAISSSTQRALDSRGGGARAAASLNRTTAPSRVHSATTGHRGDNGHARNGSRPDASDSAAASPASSLVHALTGAAASGGLGPILPIILIVALVAGSALAILRRKRTT